MCQFGETYTISSIDFFIVWLVLCVVMPARISFETRVDAEHWIWPPPCNSGK